MTKLPQELLDHILQYLPISDAASVLQATLKQVESNGHTHPAENDHGRIDFRQLKRSVENRIDPATHLRKGFANFEQLIECMSRTGTVLIGPRAFEYFSGDSCQGYDGTWDFLAQWFPAEVLDILIALCRAGVVWENPLQRASRQYRECSECQEVLRNAALAAAAAENFPEGLTSTLQRLSECKSHERRGILTSVHGVARDGKTPVILHVQELNTEALYNVITAPFSHLCDVRLSHLQCMVGGCTAVHMNFAATKEKQTFILNQGSREPVDLSLIPEDLHISQRLETHGVLRALVDRGSLCMDLSRFSRIDREIASTAHRATVFAIWYEYHSATVHVPSLVDCASTHRIRPFLRFIWGEQEAVDVERLVGRPNHNFYVYESLRVLDSEYGVVNDWV